MCKCTLLQVQCLLLALNISLFILFVIYTIFLAVCMHTFNKSSGLITSPNHPLNYPQYTDCTYLITAKQDEKIYLFPEAFAIEAHSSCNYDSLSINDGGKNSAPLQKSPFCGLDLFKDIPLYMSSTGNKLYLKFKTDFSVTHPGFAITYIASQEGKLTKILQNFFTRWNYKSYLKGSNFHGS